MSLEVGDKVSYVTNWDAVEVRVGMEVVGKGKVAAKKVAGAWVTLTTNAGEIVKTTKRKPVSVRIYGLVESVMEGLVGVEYGRGSIAGVVPGVTLIALVRPEKIEAGTW